MQLPSEGKAIRFAPALTHEPAASFWKVWSEGNEIYALARNPSGLAKISVHASGQIHYRLGPKLKHDLAPLIPLPSGSWLHAFELRFLVSEGARAPIHQRESLKNKSAVIISVPKGFVLYVNLIVGAAEAPLDCSIPAEFSGGQTLWRTSLRSGRPAALVARTLELDSQNRDNIKYLRETLKPTATFSGRPNEAYVEVWNVNWSPTGGNVILVVPMGEEAIRFEHEQTSPAKAAVEHREFRYEGPLSTTEVIAPNGQRVAMLEFQAIDKKIELKKNRPEMHGVGVFKVRLESAKLIAGSKFMASPCKLACPPKINGASPRSWEYAVFAQFDGNALCVELRELSTSLRNRSLETAIAQLNDQEELVMTIPFETVKLSATMDAPVASTEVVGRFTLRDWR